MLNFLFGTKKAEPAVAVAAPPAAAPASAATTAERGSRQTQQAHQLMRIKKELETIQKRYVAASARPVESFLEQLY